MSAPVGTSPAPGMALGALSRDMSLGTSRDAPWGCLHYIIVQQGAFVAVNRLDLDGGVANAEVVVQLMRELVEEAVTRMPAPASRDGR